MHGRAQHLCERCRGKAFRAILPREGQGGEGLPCDTAPGRRGRAVSEAPDLTQMFEHILLEPREQHVTCAPGNPESAAEAHCSCRTASRLNVRACLGVKTKPQCLQAGAETLYCFTQELAGAILVSQPCKFVALAERHKHVSFCTRGGGEGRSRPPRLVVSSCMSWDPAADSGRCRTKRRRT